MCKLTQINMTKYLFEETKRLQIVKSLESQQHDL